MIVTTCGTFEDYVQYLKPMRALLTAPLAIIGLEPPESFKIATENKGSKRVGHVVRYETITF